VLERKRDGKCKQRTDLSMHFMKLKNDKIKKIECREKTVRYHGPLLDDSCREKTERCHGLFLGDP